MLVADLIRPIMTTLANAVERMGGRGELVEKLRGHIYTITILLHVLYVSVMVCTVMFSFLERENMESQHLEVKF